MPIVYSRRSSIVLLAGWFLLAACGGGSGGNDNAAAPAGASSGSAAPPTTTGDGAASAPSAPTPDSSTNVPPATGTAAPSASYPAVPAQTSCNLPNFVQSVMQAVNAARAQSRTCGATSYAAAAPLAWNDKLFAAAAAHSQDMATNNYFSHTSQNGTSFSQRITNAGYSWRGAAENIAAGQTTVDSVMNGWLASAGHCANIMNPQLRDIGVACVKASAAAYSTYWTMSLAAPR